MSELPHQRALNAWQWLKRQGYDVVFGIDPGQSDHSLPMVYAGLVGTNTPTTAHYDSCSCAVVALAFHLGWPG